MHREIQAKTINDIVEIVDFKVVSNKQPLEEINEATKDFGDDFDGLGDEDFKKS